MKKISIILAMAALGVAFTSCKQEDEPKFKEPTINANGTAAGFRISTPALQDVAFRTASEMTDEETFNLFCSQPNYGYSAVCNYSVIVSLKEDCPFNKEDGTGEEGASMLLPNENPTSAAMAIKTFELGAAINKLKGITSQEAFDAAGMGNEVYQCYFRAVCEIPGIEGSRVVSSNIVSYNQVYLTFAVKKPAWVYICGDVQTDEAGTVKNGFLAPKPSNLAKYDEYWRVYEPKEKIGDKLFVGTFWLTPKDPANFQPLKPDSKDGEFNVENPNACAQFRFFTKLGGWSEDYSLGSHSDDFYVVKITDKWMAGYNGEIVDHGLGNWGIFVEDPAPFTVVVDTKDLKIFVKEGVHEVTFKGRDPEFN